MAQTRFSMVVCALLPAVLAAACETVGQEEELGLQRAALTSDNGLAYNGLAYNGLAYNGLSWNGLSWNGLAYNGLAYNGMAFNGMSYNGMSYNGLAYNGMAYNGMSYNGMSYNGLADPVVQSFVTYLVGCALPADDSVTYAVDGQEWTFSGEIGLAPEWKNGPCGESCQRWITSCMLSRLNLKGEHMRISLRGDHPALNTIRFEERDMNEREATYYGNLFTDPSNIYVCHAPESASIPRVCGDDLAACPMNVVGSCEDACRGPGRHRSFRDCGPENKNSVQLFSEAITVFLGRD